MSDCRFGVSPVNYPDPDPDTFPDQNPETDYKNESTKAVSTLSLFQLLVISQDNHITLVFYPAF